MSECSAFIGNPKTESESDQESENRSLESDQESENRVLSEINSEFSQIITSTQTILQQLDTNMISLQNILNYNPNSIYFNYNDNLTDLTDIIEDLHQKSLQNITDNATINFGELLIDFLETL